MADEAVDNTGPLSLSDAVSLYSNTLDENGQPKEPADTDDQEVLDDSVNDPELDDDDLDEGEADDASEDDAEDDADGEEQAVKEAPKPPDTKFVADTAKVKLDDGRVVSVADLKKGTLLQSDYTKKTQEHAAEVQKHQAAASEVKQYAEKVHDDRKFLAQMAAQMMPQEPPDSLLDPASSDYNPQLHQQWSLNYQRQRQALGHLHQQIEQHDARSEAEAQASFLETRKVEQEKLFEKRATFKDQKAQANFWKSVETIGPEVYGFTRQEVEMLNDHRDIMVLEDALKWQRLQRKKGRAQVKSQGKPPVLTGGQRRTPDQQRHDAYSDAKRRLDKSHSYKDGVRAILALEQRK